VLAVVLLEDLARWVMVGEGEWRIKTKMGNLEAIEMEPSGEPRPRESEVAAQKWSRIGDDAGRAFIMQ
jgi:hypothetical protein